MSTTSTRLLLTTLAAAGLLLSGCFDRGLSNWEKERLEARASDDLDQALGELAGATENIDDAAAARGTFEVDRAGYAGCTRHYVFDGDAVSGTLDMELQGVPCTASLTVNDVRYEYSITEWAWSGSWEQFDETWWDVERSGGASSALTIEGSERNDGVYDASFVMNEATARTDGDGNLAFWSVDYSYSGFLDREWEVVVAKDEDGVTSGTITSNDGVNCTVSGEEYDYVIDCE